MVLEVSRMKYITLTLTLTISGLVSVVYAATAQEYVLAAGWEQARAVELAAGWVSLSLLPLASLLPLPWA